MSAVMPVPNVPNVPNVSSIASARVLPKGRIYLFEVGTLYIGAPRTQTKKYPLGPCVTLALQEGNFELGFGNSQIQHVSAAAFRPLLEHAISSPEVSVAVAVIGPAHPLFRHFLALPAQGPLVLRREMFETYAVPLDEERGGQRSIESGRRLFEAMTRTVAEHFPSPAPLDRRVERAIELLRQDLGLSLDELAASVHISYHRLSHLFSESLGLPLRSYRTLQRMYMTFELLAKGYKQADILRLAGFADVSHFSRVIRGACGVLPSAFFNQRIKVLIN